MSAEKKKDGFTARLGKGSIHSAILCYPVLVWFIIVVVNTMTKGKWKKRVYLASMLQVVIEINQCSNMKIQN